MPNSSTGGYLLPTSTPPLDDALLDQFFHDLIMGVTGLGATLIRPRWQPEPGNMPAAGSTWVAQGVTNRGDDVVAWTGFNSVTGVYTIARNQELTNLVSIYGAAASATEAILRDGLSLAQNREHMNSLGFAFVKVGETRNMSLMLNERWQKRIDVELTFRRFFTREYAVLPLLSAATTITTNTGFVETITAI